MNHQPNRMQRRIGRLKEVPAFLRPWAQSLVLRRAVPFTGTAGLDFITLTPRQVNRDPNPSGSRTHRRVHASAMNLLPKRLPHGRGNERAR